ncbi:MAG: hypothetical protein U0V64_03200 [Cyclobacteriaceae bacterium]
MSSNTKEEIETWVVIAIDPQDIFSFGNHECCDNQAGYNPGE